MFSYNLIFINDRCIFIYIYAYVGIYIIHTYVLIEGAGTSVHSRVIVYDNGFMYFISAFRGRACMNYTSAF